MAPDARKCFIGFLILFFSFGDAEAAAMCSQDTTIAKASCAVTFLNPYRESRHHAKNLFPTFPKPNTMTDMVEDIHVRTNKCICNCLWLAKVCERLWYPIWMRQPPAQPWQCFQTTWFTVIQLADPLIPCWCIPRRAHGAASLLGASSVPPIMINSTWLTQVVPLFLAGWIFQLLRPCDHDTTEQIDLVLQLRLL